MRKTSIELADEAYRLDRQIGFLLRRAYQKAAANLTRRFGDCELTPPQFATMARLLEKGALSQNRLGRLVAMEPANIRDVTRRLNARGLVAIGRDPSDARLRVVRLTAAGQALTRELLAIDVEATAETLAPLEAREQRVLYELLGKLVGANPEF